MKKIFLTTLLFSLSTMAPFTNAGLVIDITNATSGNSADPYDIIGTKNGYYGAILQTDDSAITNLIFEFVGSEAVYDNNFIIRSSTSNEEELGDSDHTIVNHPDGLTGTIKADDSNRQSAIMDFGANEWLDFTFTVNNPSNGPGIDDSLDNADNKVPKSIDAINGNKLNFFVAFEYDEEGSIESLLLGLDDGGGAFGSTDEDHNDIVIRISNFESVTFKDTSIEAPLPGSLPLFLSALGTGVILIKRRT